LIFSSEIFLFLFLPIFLALYYLSPKKVKTFVLLIASLLFYTWGEEVLVLVMLTSTVVDFFCGILIERGYRRIGLGLSLLTNLGLLGFFKYFNFSFENFNSFISIFGYDPMVLEGIPEIILPIGISFYTFQTLSYTIDVYRGQVKANRNFIQFASYVTMFPQLVAGPIVRYADIAHQLANKEISISNFTIGVERFIVGLAKKVLIANTFATIADGIFAENLNDLSTPMAWLGILAYTFQIYFDFSGYSDMAIGLGRMLGFDFLENFNYPYIAKSVREFWRRWHISLSTWFRDYVYISLGGNRRGSFRTYVNLFIVFFVTGLWHGASWNFVIWGLFHGVLLVLERFGFDKQLNKAWKPFQHAYTLLAVIVGWVLFRAETLGDATTYLGKMFWYTSGDITLNSYLSFLHFDFRTVFFIIMATLFSTPVYRYIDQMVLSPKVVGVRPLFYAALLIISIVYVGSESYNPFIYFRF